MRNRFLCVFILVFSLAAVGCGDGKTEIPKDLNKPLPPPPMGASAGGGGAAKSPKDNQPSNSQQ